MKFTNLDNEYNSINVLDKPLDFVNVESEENDFLLLNPVVIEVPNVKESLEEEPSIVIKTPNVYKCLPEYLKVENALSEFNTEELKQRARENLNIESLDESKFYTKEEIDDKGFITDVSNKQDKLVSGSNIKTINGESILGKGDVIIENVQSDWNEVNEESLSYIQNKPKINFDVKDFVPTITSEGMLLGDKINFSYLSTIGLLSFGFENGSIFWERYKKVDGNPVAYRSFILSNGDGTNFLSDDGTYKNINLSNYATKQELGNKQNVIPDLDIIRNNANNAVQPELLATVATSGSYKDLNDTPNEITQATISNWGFTKNTGTYSKPVNGIPISDLHQDVLNSLNKADTALQEHQDISGKQDVILDIELIRDGAARGATALQYVPSEYITKTELNNKGYLTEHLDISGKQDKLISGTTIKTIDGESILGSGNISLPELNALYDETNQRLILSLTTLVSV